jgi:uncharacterized protein YcnI
MKIGAALIAFAAASLVAAPAAFAHVTVNPTEAKADTSERFAIRVPNEEENADTTKLVVQLPENFLFASFATKPGWTRTETTAKLAKPVTVGDDTVSDRIATVTWSGGKIASGEFDEFGMTGRVPNTPGQVLVFPAVQTYSNGKVVRWIGSADADEPAPRVTISAASTTPVAAADDSSSDNGRANVAIVLGALGLAAGIVALVLVLLGRRRQT